MAAGGSVRLDENTEIRGEQVEMAFTLAWKVHKESDKHYLLETNHKSDPPQVYISFPASDVVKDWYSQRIFGETRINLDLFPSLKSIGNDEPALVNEAFQKRFQDMLANPSSSLATQVEHALREHKQIVFTGHSSGAPMAILATLWTLEKSHLTMGIPPLCITFGSPLVGNHIFSHATRRENWSRYFVHIVMSYDIVPRIFLAPFPFLDEGFQTILKFLDPNSESFMSESVVSNSEASDFYFAIMSNAATVISHATSKLMGSTNNSTLETLENFIPLSPYKPFGTYIFVIENGKEVKQIVVRNPDAVLQLMFFSAQLSPGEEIDQVSNRILREHIIHGTNLQQALGMHHVVYLDQFRKLPLSEDVASDCTTLNDIGLSPRARLFLRAAAEFEIKRSKKQKKIEKKKDFIEMKMMELVKYRERWEHKKGGYYNCFKEHQMDPEDFEANIKRIELVGTWDEIIDKLRSYALPDEFESKDEWIELGTRFRELVEPLDIANYYRFSLDRDGGGSYKSKGRPKRYKYTQRWLEHAQRMPPEANPGSCFWADVEELCKI